jgi:hypothetical protein
VDVRIGVTNTMREIDLDVDDSIERDQLKDHIEKALSSDDGVLWIADKRGREVAIPSGKVAYVEIGSPADGRTIGFTA